RLHYDLRLEMEGVLKSWAVPKGPSLNVKDKRLAMMTEDHPFSYKDFEGEIPEGNYGAGIMEIWDKGTYNALDAEDRKEAEASLLKGLEKGDLKFVLNGEKLKGAFALVRIKNDDSGQSNSWLLIKKKDEHAVNESYNSEDNIAADSKIKKGGNPKIKTSKNTTSKKEATIKKAEKKPAEPDQKVVQVDAPKVNFPQKIKPMLAKLIDNPFDDPDYIYEIKWDGYRAIAGIQGNEVSLYSRNGLSFNEKYPSLIKYLGQVTQEVVLDGEVVVLNSSGHANFQMLQNYKEEYAPDLCYYVFDILYLNGHTLVELPLVERKKYINEVIKDLPNIRYSDHIAEHGTLFFKEAEDKNLEGIIAKKGSSPYRIGKRSNDWLKIKTSQRQEFIICGYTEPKGGRKHLGSLILGAYEGKELVYAGHSGGGFTDKDLKETKEKLDPLIQNKSPFKKKIKANGAVTWLRPELVCDVSFAEWTDEKILRHPIFQGFREDKEANEVKIEQPAEIKTMGNKLKKIIENPEKSEKSSLSKSRKTDTKSKKIDTNKAENAKETKGKKSDNEDTEVVDRIKSPEQEKASDKPEPKKLDKNREKVKVGKHSLILSNLKKVYFHESGITKGDLINYYSEVGKFILPHLKDRPQSLHRHPNGINRQSFYHKDMKDTLPDWAESKLVHSDGNNKEINYLLCQNQSTLTYMNNLGCIEINPWNSRVQSLDNPDYTIIDLDPADNTFEEVIETALVVKSILDRAGATCFCKTSGASGMHIFIPLGGKYD
ncbi:MAG: non-homologous end-joining DNA ligase, partial [Bacteroidota bacterium]|nr:non-homologous end-joining DNA ligase [Bacteroidota bacterium]